MGAIAFYLDHPAESEEYLRGLKHKWEDLERMGRRPDEGLRKKLVESRQRLFADKP